MKKSYLLLRKKKHKSFNIFFKSPFFFIFKGFLGECFFKISKKFIKVCLKKIKSKLFLVQKVIFFSKNLYSFEKFLRNVFLGSSFGWFCTLEFSGRGYFINCNKNSVKINLGFSHGIGVLQKKSLTIISKKSFRNKIILHSNNFFILKNFSYKMKFLRPLDCYKGRGVKFFNENIKLKVGKRAF